MRRGTRLTGTPSPAPPSRPPPFGVRDLDLDLDRSRNLDARAAISYMSGWCLRGEVGACLRWLAGEGRPARVRANELEASLWRRLVSKSK